jgi:hypothetical protein
VDRVATRRQLLDCLIREKGIDRYGLFAVTTEGKRLPDGSESASGLVIDGTGQVFSFWLDWCEERNRIALIDWEPVSPEPDWNDDEEYREAREVAGLSA